MPSLQKADKYFLTSLLSSRTTDISPILSVAREGLDRERALARAGSALRDLYFTAAALSFANPLHSLPLALLDEAVNWTACASHLLAISRFSSSASRYPKSAFRELKALDLIDFSYHPTLPLTIVSYTHAAQIDRQAWTLFPLLSLCRGLVLTEDPEDFGLYRIVGRPFRKFWNLGELTLPQESWGLPEITTKLDGCFARDTRLTLWDGSTIPIAQLVKEQKSPLLMGVDAQGKIVPSRIIEYATPSSKTHWLRIGLNRPLRLDGRGASRPPALWVTPNHHIWVNDVCQPIGNARVGDRLTGHVRVLSPSIIHLVKSSLLGDGCLTPNGPGCKFQESHIENHADYIEEIHRWLGEAAIKRGTTLSGYGSKMLWATTSPHESLAALRQEWYNNGKRRLPQDLSWINDFSVAKWYMDNGSLAHSPVQQDRACFATNRFTQEEVVRLGEKLSEFYGVNCTVYNSKGWCLRVNAGKNNEINKLWEAIAPHILPCMRYKIPERFRDIPYTRYPSGSYSLETREVFITSIEATHRNPKYQSELGYDIQTSTGNYFASGVLVHNSLIIAFPMHPHADSWELITRGSWSSTQAEASRALWAREGRSFAALDPAYTYLFEYTAPTNQIVVHYQAEELTLLGLVETATGRESSYAETRAEAERLSLPLVPQEPLAHWDDLARRNLFNFEGYVLHWPEQQIRLKIKLDFYRRTHALVSAPSPHQVWAMLKDDLFDAFLLGLPPESAPWFEECAAALSAKYAALAQGVTAAAARQRVLALSPHASRGEIAEVARRITQAKGLTDLQRTCLLAQMRGRPYEDLLWKAIEP